MASTSAHSEELEVLMPSLTTRITLHSSIARREAVTMSLIFRRGLSTIVPPKIASTTGIGAAKDAARMQRLVKFYEKLPTGPALEPKASGPISWYRRRYMGKNASGAPIFHAIVFFLVIGYSQEYYFHLRHHKNNAH